MSTYDAPPGPGPAFDPASYAHTMVADARTARILGRGAVRYRLTRASTLATFLIALVLAAFAAPGVIGSPGRGAGAAIGFVAPLGLLVVVGLNMMTVLRNARRIAPPGTVLAFDAGPGAVRVRHALAEATLLHEDLRAVTEKGDCTLLVLRGGGLLPLPTALVDADLEHLLDQLAAHRDAGATAAAPGAAPPTPPADLPYVLDCTEGTASRLHREFTLRALRQPGFVVCVVAVVLAVTVAFTGSALAWPVLGSLVAVLLLTVLGIVRARGQFRRYYGPGTRVAVGVVDGDLLIQRAGRLSRIALSGIKDVRPQPSGLVVRTTGGGRESLPTGLLPPAEVERLRSAARWYGSRR